MEAAEEFRRRKEDFDLARKKLAEAMVIAARAGMAQTEIIRISGYTREHVRRILRDGGIDPPEQRQRDMQDEPDARPEG